MTERFTYEKHKVKDNLTGEFHSSNMVSVNVLNQLNDENEQLKTQLKNTSDQRDEFHRGARENANNVGKLIRENEELKKMNQNLRERLNHAVALNNGLIK